MGRSCERSPKHKRPMLGLTYGSILGLDRQLGGGKPKKPTGPFVGSQSERSGGKATGQDRPHTNSFSFGDPLRPQDATIE